LTVVAVAVLWIGIVPQVNNVLRYNDPVKPGERMAVAAGISFAPPAGWNVEAGLRTTDKIRTGAAGAPVTLASDAITMKVMPVPFRGGPRQLTAAVETILVRGATGFFSHALYTAIFCAGVIHAIGTRFLRRDLARGVVLMLAAVLLHGIRDGADAITDGIGSTLLMLADGIAGILILVWLLRISAPQEREWTRDVLAPEVEGGAISAEELDALAGTPKQRRKYVRAPGGTRTRKGRRRWSRLKQGNRLVAEIARSGSAADCEAAAVRPGRTRRRLAKL